VKDLSGLEAEGLDPVEDALARMEQNGRNIEHELVNHPGAQSLLDCGGPTCDIDTVIPGY
jgi:hypothetical protein